MRAPEAELWHFSLRVYAAAGVPKACLWLQDERRLDVNLLLFCVWFGLGRGDLPPELLRESAAFSRAWSGAVVKRLRAVRRSLPKNEHPYSEAQRVELLAERAQQEGLQRIAEALRPRRQPAASARRSAAGNLERYLRLASSPRDAAAAARTETLLDAALG